MIDRRTSACWRWRWAAWGRAGWAPEAYLALFLHSWKGNVRELAKVMAVARVLAEDGQPVELAHLPGPIAARVDARAGAARPRAAGASDPPGTS